LHISTLQPKLDRSKYPADKAEIQLEHLRHDFSQQRKINHGSPIDSSWLIPSAAATAFSSSTIDLSRQLKKT